MCHISILMGSKRQICIKQKQTFYDLFGGGKTKISMQIIQLGNFEPFSGSSLAHKAHFKSDHKKILQNIQIREQSKNCQANNWTFTMGGPENHILYIFVDFNRCSFGSWFYLQKFADFIRAKCVCIN